MALDNGFDQLARGAVLGLPSYPDGFFPAIPDPVVAAAGQDTSGFPVPPPANFPNTHCIWGFNMFKRLPDVAERSYEHSAGYSVFAVAPSDTVLLPQFITQFYLGTTGSVRLETEAAEIITLSNLEAGIRHSFPFSIVKIFATGTTATLIVGVI